MNLPLVSIVCLTFNHEKFIRDAVHGFLIQKTDFPFEILVHDIPTFTITDTQNPLCFGDSNGTISISITNC